MRKAIGFAHLVSLLALCMPCITNAAGSTKAGKTTKSSKNDKGTVGTFLLKEIDYEKAAGTRRLQGSGNQPQETLNVEFEDGRIYELIEVNPSWSNGVAKGLLSGVSRIRIPEDVKFVKDTNKIDFKGGNPEVVSRQRELTTPQRHLALSGTRTVLAVRVFASDGQYEFSEDILSDKMFGTAGVNGESSTDGLNLKSGYEACSFGKLIINPAGDRVGTGATINNGVTTISVGSKINAGEGVIENEVTLAINEAFGVSNPSDLADHVIYCFPPNAMDGIGYAYYNHWGSRLRNEWCNYPSLQMHEIGHNFDFKHSQEGDVSYEDQSGLMGYSYSNDEGPKMCFNAAKSFQAGWYSDKTVIVTPGAAQGNCFSGSLHGFADYELADASHVILKVNNANSDLDYYVMYNAAKGIQSGTQEGRNQVLVVNAGAEGLSRDYSNLLAKLNAGQSYTFPTLTDTVLHVDSVVNGAAQVRVETNGEACGPPSPTIAPVPTTSPPTTATAPLSDVGDNGSPSAEFPLGNCEGDCDNGSECESGLTCFQRTSNQVVPGCDGSGTSGNDYCAYRAPGSLWLMGDNGSPSANFPLGACEGDCDTDADCAPGLKCFQRNGDESVPGCTGPGNSGEDYCYSDASPTKEH